MKVVQTLIVAAVIAIPALTFAQSNAPRSRAPDMKVLKRFEVSDLFPRGR